MAYVTIWRKLVTTEWEQTARLDREDVEQWGEGDPLRLVLLAALDSGEGVSLELTPALTSALYEDMGWKGREVMDTTIAEADVEVEED